MGILNLKYHDVCTVWLHGLPRSALYVGHNAETQEHIFLARNPNDKSDIIPLRAQESEQEDNSVSIDAYLRINRALTKFELEFANELMQGAGI